MDFEQYLGAYKQITQQEEISPLVENGLKILYLTTHADRLPIPPDRLTRDFMCFVIGRQTALDENLALKNETLRESLGILSPVQSQK